MSTSTPELDQAPSAIKTLVGGGCEVYRHPQGSWIVVHGRSVVKIGPDNKRKNTSATADKLRAGHGRWIRVYNDGTAPLTAPASNELDDVLAWLDSPL